MFKESTEFANPEKTVEKTDVFSLEGLVAWLEKQPAGRTYNFHDCRGACLLAQYLAAHGIKWAADGSSYAEMVEVTTGHGIDVSCNDPWTYGAALARARALLERK